MPFLSPSAWPSAWPSTIAVSSMVWCPSMSHVALGAHGQVEAGVAAERGRACGRRTARRCRRRRCRFRRGRVRRRCRTPWSCARRGRGGFGHVDRWLLSGRGRQTRAGVQERVVLVGQAGGGAQVSGNADVADQDAGVEVALPGGGRVGELTEQHEVGVAGDDPKTHAAQGFGDPLTFGDQCGDAGQRLVGVSQRGACGGLGERRQVVRQPHQQHRVDHRGRGDQVAEPAAGERERLAHRARHDQLGRVLLDEADRAWRRRELAVRLVEDQDAGVHRVEQPAQIVQRNALPRRVVRAGDEHDVGAVLDDRGDGRVGVEAEVVGAVCLQPPRLGAVGDDRVHRVRRHEADCAAARPAERLQQLLQHLVGTVGGPEVFDADLHAGLARSGRRRGRCAARPRRGRDSGAGSRRLPAPSARRRRPVPAWADAGSRWCSAAPARRVAVRRKATCRAGPRAAARSSSVHALSRELTSRTSGAPPRRGRADPRPWPA